MAEAMGSLMNSHRSALTFAGSPDSVTAGHHHVTETRKLFANAVRFLNPQPRVKVSAPPNVEVVITDDPRSRTLRLHFIGCNIPAQTTPAKNCPYILPGLMEPPPIYRTSVDLRDPMRSVDALNVSTEIIWRSDTGIDLRVEDTHEVLVIRY